MVRSALVGAAAIAVLVAGCGGTKTVTRTVTVATPTRTGFGPPQPIWEYGQIKSLTAKGGGFELKFDPSWLVSGETANAAALQDGFLKPGQSVPDDNYVVDEGHRLLTYVVPADARVSVITYGGDPAQLSSEPITVGELAKLVDGTSDQKLFEPLSTGVWIEVQVDTVRSLDQQYHP